MHQLKQSKYRKFKNTGFTQHLFTVDSKISVGLNGEAVISSKKGAGFTLLELLVTMSVLAILSVTVFSSLFSFQRDTQVSSTTETLASTIRTTQSKSMASEDAFPWAFHLDTTTTPHSYAIFLFSGTNFATGSQKTIFYLPSQLSLSNITLNGGGSDIIFDRSTGATNNFGTATSSTAFCLSWASDPATCKASIMVTKSGKIDWK